MFDALEINDLDFIHPISRCISALTPLVGLLHDLGKATRSFQLKLIDPHYIGADVIRHERLSSALLSSLFVALYEQGELSDDFSDKAIFTVLSTLPVERLKCLFQLAATSENLREHFSNNTSSSIYQFDSESWTNAEGMNNSVFNAVNYLVLTHHSMPTNHKGKSLDTDIKENKYVNPTKSGEQIEWADNPPHLSNTWLSEFQRQCKRLADMDFTPIYEYISAFTDAILFIARPALVIADQHISFEATEKAKQVLEQTGKVINSELQICFANSFNDDSGHSHYAQSLEEHLFQVSQQSLILVNASLQALYQEENTRLPALQKSPSVLAIADSQGVYQWQNDVRAITGKLPSSGNLILISAETGTGKTRANALAISGLRQHKGIRLTSLLGMNTLTKQTATEYIHDLQFGKAACAITGHAVTKFEIQQALEQPSFSEDENGCENLHADDYEVDGIEQQENTLPPELRCHFKPKYDQILATPIVVATIDHLIESVQNPKSSCSRLLLRLQSSDLIIDEIDSYHPDSLISIYKLVYLAGFYRRNLIVSTATLRPAVAHALVEMFHKGIQTNNHVFGRQNDITGAVFSNLPDVSFSANNLDEFTQIIEKQSTQVALTLAHQTSKRCAGWIDAKNGQQLFAHAKTLHKAHHVSLSQTNGEITFSAGAIRLNNVKYVKAVARHLAKIQDNDIELAVICYHSRLAAPVRYRLEKCLDIILKRKTQVAFEQALLNEREFQDTLTKAKANNKKHIMLIVVCSPIEETGRDHDFDWGMTEPCSHHSLIQFAGRIRRHRDVCSLDIPNLLIMKQCFKAQYEKNRTPYLSMPGAETASLKLENDMTTKAAFSCDGVDYEQGIDARACLLDLPLTQIKQQDFTQLNDIEIQQAHNARFSIREYMNDPHARLSCAHAQYYPLREQDHGVPIWFDGSEWKRPTFIDSKKKNKQQGTQCSWQFDRETYPNLWFNKDMQTILNDIDPPQVLRALLCHPSSAFMITENENKQMSRMTFNNAIGLFDEDAILDGNQKIFEII